MKVVRVALGLSGGVDSAVSAYLLKKQGYDVLCVYLNCYNNDDPKCRAKTDRADALKIAMHLGLPFKVLDFRKEYQAAVIDYFKREYLAGRTPNPDVVCNRDIKFGLFLDWAIKNHFDAVATGHYAKLIIKETIDNRRSKIVVENRKWKIDSDNQSSIIHVRPQSSIFNHPSSAVVLARPLDEHKDQTYFLWQVPREKFKRVLFPLADYLKSEVREIARKIKLPVANKKDSTGICFVGEISVEEFLKRLGVKEKRGEVIMKIPNHKHQITNKFQTTSSKSQTKKNLGLGFENWNLFGTCNLEFGASSNYQVIGSHKGVWFYTIGQRHGFQIFNFQFSNSNEILNSKQSDRPPLYIIEKDVKNNRLIVGFGAECYRGQFFVSQINWLTTDYRLQTTDYRLPPEQEGKKTVDSSQWSVDCLVRLRHCGELIPCKLLAVDSSQWSVDLQQPQRGIAPGQSAVFYTKEGVVLGGGIIQ